MSPADLEHFISASVVPVVIISACGLLLLAFYNRLAYIVSRLRSFQRERLQQQDRYTEILNKHPENTAALQRLRNLRDMLAAQTEHVYRRARLIRVTITCLLGAIACLTICSLAAGLTVLFPTAIYLAIPYFVTGVLLLLIGVIFALLELKGSLTPVEHESRFVSRLADELYHEPEVEPSDDSREREA